MILIDTSFLLAVGAAKDEQHQIARHAFCEIRSQRVIVAPVLPELFYVLRKRVDYLTVRSFFNTIRTEAFQIEVLTAADMAQMNKIMVQYADHEFDFVDTAIMAVAERLKITRIYTFDRRDFGAYRPRHCAAFDLLP